MLEGREALDGMSSESRGPDAFSRNVLREVAHLLRSPLGSIVMLSGTLQEEGLGPLTEAQSRQLQIIHRAALSLASTIGDLLTLVDEEPRSKSTRFCVGDIVERVANIVRPVTVARRCDLIVGRLLQDQRIGPAKEIGRAYLGLALRAALATRDGSIELAATPIDDETVAFTVAAQGSGALVEEAGAFGGLELDGGSAAVALSATGLGVSAAAEIVRSMGSELRVNSGGSEFRAVFDLRLPKTD